MRTSQISFLMFMVLFTLCCCECSYSNKNMIDTNLPVFPYAIDYSYDKKMNNEFYYKHTYFYKEIGDIKNKWVNKFSTKYFEIQIMYADSSFVILYCVVSGIKNGYLLFPIKYSVLVLIDRLSGNKIIDIETENGILNAKFSNNIIFFKCYDPNVNRYYKIL